jgi:hypothetical protein
MFIFKPGRRARCTFGILEEIHDFLQLELGLIDAGDVLEANPRYWTRRGTRSDVGSTGTWSDRRRRHPRS